MIISKNKKLGVGVAVGIAALALAGSAVAATPGAYVGGQLGWGDTHVDFDPSATSSDTTGVAGRVNAGYQFNNFLGAELGYTQFTTADAHGLFFHESEQTKAVDLVAKATLPLADGFSLFGKLGVADEINEAHINVGNNVMSWSDQDDRNRVLPTFGAGVAYAFNEHLAGDVSWMHIQKCGSNDGTINNTDLVGVGLTYSFG